MTSPEEALRAELVRRLLADHKQLPTTSVGRLGRTAVTLLRIQRAANAIQSGASDDVSNIEAIARIVSSIGQLKGISMKVGQIMSYIDVALPEELRNALAVLQTHGHAMPIERAREIIREDLGDRAADLLVGLEAEPLAAASIGQVHRARLPDGTTVAVKVRYPEIERAIQSDFRPAVLGTTIAALVYPGADVEDFIEEARARFLEECDYLHEAAAQRRFAAVYASDPVIAVPEIHDAYCSRRVLTSTWLDGIGFEAFLQSEPEQHTRDRIGEALFGFYVGSLFTHRLYNCDPHPGNYVFLPDGRIGMLDYGCTREFEPAFVANLAKLTLAVHQDERNALHRSFVDLRMVREGERYDFDAARGLVRAFYGSMLKDAVQRVDLGEAKGMRDVFQSKRELMKLKLPGEFLFLFRIRFGLMSVLAKLGARANWYRLERKWAQAAQS